MQDGVSPKQGLGVQRGGRNRCRGIAGHRLEHDAGQRQIEFGGLFGNDEAIFRIGHHNWRGISQRVTNPLQCILI